LAWAPHSACHICTCSDDRSALIWDLKHMPKVRDATWRSCFLCALIPTPLPPTCLRLPAHHGPDFGLQRGGPHQPAAVVRGAARLGRYCLRPKHPSPARLEATRVQSRNRGRRRVTTEWLAHTCKEERPGVGGELPRSFRQLAKVHWGHLECRGHHPFINNISCISRLFILPIYEHSELARPPPNPTHKPRTEGGSVLVGPG
jgi:hypothetical protein